MGWITNQKNPKKSYNYSNIFKDHKQQYNLALHINRPHKSRWVEVTAAPLTQSTQTDYPKFINVCVHRTKILMRKGCECVPVRHATGTIKQRKPSQLHSSMQPWQPSAQYAKSRTALHNLSCALRLSGRTLEEEGVGSNPMDGRRITLCS